LQSPIVEASKQTAHQCLSENQTKEITMNTKLPKDRQFNKYYSTHCKYLMIKGLQPKTIEAYSRGIRRIGNYFNARIDNLTPDQLLDYFHVLLENYSWSTVKLDLYGLKFFY